MTKARDLANLGNKTSLDEINDAYDAGALSNTNILINGSFTVSQRGNYTSATAIGNTHTYYLDRWKSRANTVSGTLTHSTGYPFTRSQTALLTATSAGTGYMQMDQLVETNFYQGQTVVLSAWVKSNTPNARIGCYTGTWSSAAIHSGNGSWEKLSVSFTVGTGYATPLVRLGILSDGSWDVVSISSGDYIEVSEVQLEVGDTATPFEHRSYGDELAKCQRYYERIQAVGSAGYIGFSAGTIYGSGTYLGHFTASVPMRATPAFSTDALNSTSRMSVVSGDNTYSISSIAVTGNNQRLRINAAGALSGIIGQGAYIQVQNAHHVAFDAEL
jgi:hypothetical protein